MQFLDRNTCKTFLWFLCMCALSITSFQTKYNNTKILPELATHHQLPSTSSQDFEICGSLFNPAKSLTAQISFLCSRVVGMFLKISKMPSNPPHSPPFYYQPPNFSISFMLPPASNYYHGLFSPFSCKS